MANHLPEKLPEFPAVTFDEWRAAVERELGDRTPDSLHSRTEDGLDIAPLYDAANAPPLAPRPALEHGSRDGGWDVRVEVDDPSPEAASAALREDLSGGASSVRLRLAGASAGTAGSRGVLVRSVEDLDGALQGVHLEMIPVALDAGSYFLPAAAALIALWERRGTPHDLRTGELGADPIAALARDGTLSTSVEDALVQLGQLALWSASELPRVPAVRISTRAYHDAGCTAVQEIGIALATGAVYLRAMVAAGLSPADAARMVVLDLSIGTEQFQEIAKLRAMKLAWARMLEHSGVPDVAPRLTGTLAQRVLTRRDPWVNMLRGTMGAFVAAAGGASAMTVPPYDSAAGISDPLGRRVARNTQHILNEEVHAGAVADPAGGSWFVESLTHRLAEGGWEQMREIEREGGMTASLLSGAISRRIADSRARREMDVATRKRPITGVSEYPHLDERTIERTSYEDAAAEHISSGNAVVPAAVHAATLDGVHASRRSEEPAARVHAAIAAVAEGAAFHDVATLLSDGNPAMVARLEPHAVAEPFELLRDASDAHLARGGSRPRAFLATLGPLAQHAARASFTRNLLEAGGIESVEPGPLEDAPAAARELAASGCQVAVITTSDGIAAEHAEATVSALRDAGATFVVHAGRAGEREAALRAAGVDLFIHAGGDAVAALRLIQAAAGVTS